MRLHDHTGLPGLKPYLNFIAKGISTRGVEVTIRFTKGKERTRWHGHAYRVGNRGNPYPRPLITIDLGMAYTYTDPSKTLYPYEIVDQYMVSYKRLRDLYYNPHRAFGPQDLIGFIFLHELCHVRQFRQEKRKLDEWTKKVNEWTGRADTGIRFPTRPRTISEVDATLWAYEHWERFGVGYASTANP